MSSATQCPTCKQHHPAQEAEPAHWPCTLCGVVMCAMPVQVGKKTSVPCYVRHQETAHPELYAPAAAATES